MCFSHIVLKKFVSNSLQLDTHAFICCNNLFTIAARCTCACIIAIAFDKLCIIRKSYCTIATSMCGMVDAAVKQLDTCTTAFYDAASARYSCRQLKNIFDIVVRSTCVCLMLY
jgi:hypothetical protein